MSKTYLPYDPDQQLLLPAAYRSGCRRSTWPTSSPTWWTSWTLGHHGPLRRGKAGRATLSPQDDGQGAALRLLHRGGLHPVALPSVSMRTSASGCWRPTTLPTSRTVSDFRKDHLQALGGLFLQVLALDAVSTRAIRVRSRWFRGIAVAFS